MRKEPRSLSGEPDECGGWWVALLFQQGIHFADEKIVRHPWRVVFVLLKLRHTRSGIERDTSIKCWYWYTTTSHNTPSLPTKLSSACTRRVTAATAASSKPLSRSAYATLTIERNKFCRESTHTIHQTLQVESLEERRRTEKKGSTSYTREIRKRRCYEQR